MNHTQFSANDFFPISIHLNLQYRKNIHKPVFSSSVHIFVRSDFSGPVCADLSISCEFDGLVRIQRNGSCAWWGWLNHTSCTQQAHLRTLRFSHKSNFTTSTPGWNCLQKYSRFLLDNALPHAASERRDFYCSLFSLALNLILLKFTSHARGEFAFSDLVVIKLGPNRRVISRTV